MIIHSGFGNRDRRAAFTIIELLVVVSIIVVLISMLMPALEDAVTAAKRAQCLTQIKLQSLAITEYSLQNQQRYAPSGRNNLPNYHRSHSNQAGFEHKPFDAVTLLRDGGYLSPEATICPLLAHFPEYSGEYPKEGSIGDWFKDSDYIWSAYNWLPGFETFEDIEMIQGDPEPPLRGIENTARTTWITHTFYWGGNSNGMWEGLHGGRIKGVTGIKYDDYTGTDMPVGTGDGGAFIRQRESGEIKHRMNVGYAGTHLEYLW